MKKLICSLLIFTICVCYSNIVLAARNQPDLGEFYVELLGNGDLVIKSKKNNEVRVHPCSNPANVDFYITADKAPLLYLLQRTREENLYFVAVFYFMTLSPIKDFVGFYYWRPYEGPWVKPMR